MEHLREREGLDEVAVTGPTRTRWKDAKIGRAKGGMPNLGDRFWGALA
jgi:hypothetical protein